MNSTALGAKKSAPDITDEDKFSYLKESFKKQGLCHWEKAARKDLDLYGESPVYKKLLGRSTGKSESLGENICDFTFYK